MIAIVILDVLGLLGIAGFCVGMYYLASRIEPHWVSKDRTRFLTVAQELDQWGLPSGRRREVRVQVDEDSDALVISRRSLARPEVGTWIVDSKDPDPPRGRAVYELKKLADDAQVGGMALRIPLKSKILGRLDELLEATGAEVVARRERERRRAANPRPTPPTEASGTPESQPPDPPADRD